MASITKSIDLLLNVTSFDSNKDEGPPPEVTRHIGTIIAANSPSAVYVDRILTPLWYFIGLIGNFLSAMIWSQRRMRLNNSSAFYLTSLCVSDMMFLVLHSLQELKYAWWVRTLEYPVVCEGYFLLILAVQYISPALVLCFTVERFIAVCHPFAKERFCTESRAAKIVASVVVICISLCAIQAYFWHYDPDTEICDIREEVQDGGNISLWSVWSWVTETLMFVCIPLVILVFNILVIVEVRKVSQNGIVVLVPVRTQGSNPSTTLMLLSVSFYVIATTLPATLVYVLHAQFPVGDLTLSNDEISRDPVWKRYLVYVTVRKIVEEVCLSHYACNVFLYLATGPQFRAVFVEMLCRSRHRSPLGSSVQYSNRKTNKYECKANDRHRLNFAHV